MYIHTPDRPRIGGGVEIDLARRQLEEMIVGTYREMPGLSLHLLQAVRLFGVQTATCKAVLDDLVRRGLLRRAGDGQYLTY